MSTEKAKTKAKGQAKGAVTEKYTPKPRKATFTVEKEKGQLIYRPVNKRAHKWAKKVGKRTRLTRDDIKAIKATKRVKVYAYDITGALKVVR